MKDIVYRLGDYKIIESDTGILHWEAHSGIGILEEGMCYLKGDILFIDPVEYQKEGFLKLEFIESFKSAEFWSKTGFFCINAEIFNCLHGKKVTREEKLRWGSENRRMKESEEASPGLYGSGTEEGLRSCSYRLQKHIITKMQDGNFVWSSHAGANIIKSGPCFLLEDILFLCTPGNRMEGLSREQFLTDLRQLPEWHQTKYYASECILHECEAVNQVRDAGKSLTDFFKVRDCENKEDVKDCVPASSSNTGKDTRAFKLKTGNIQRPPKIKIKKILAVILFGLLILLLFLFLLITRRDHRERSHYKSDEYSHRNYRKH